MPDRSLREPTFFVLAALAREPAHGYRLMSAIEELSGGRVAVRAGTLYGVLDRLRRDGFIEHESTESGDGPPRHSYRITERGIDLLADEVHRLEANVGVGRTSLDGAAWT